ncbi:hypothetical protein Tco_0614864 [Tanacetum coccineum]
MAEDNALFDHKMALLPVKTHKIGVFTSCNIFSKTGEANFQRNSKDREVIHEDSIVFFNHVRERWPTRTFGTCPLHWHNQMHANGRQMFRRKRIQDGEVKSFEFDSGGSSIEDLNSLRLYKFEFLLVFLVWLKCNRPQNRWKLELSTYTQTSIAIPICSSGLNGSLALRHAYWVSSEKRDLQHGIRHKIYACTEIVQGIAMCLMQENSLGKKESAGLQAFKVEANLCIRVKACQKLISKFRSFEASIHKFLKFVLTYSLRLSHHFFLMEMELKLRNWSNKQEKTFAQDLDTRRI